MAFGRTISARALALCTLLSGPAALLVPSDATASVSIAVAFDALVKDADAVAVVTAGEPSSVWEDGRIYTYTKVHVDRGIAGELGAGADGVVRTMGGVVGKVGQHVDGEPVLTKGKPSLLFLRSFKAGGIYEVAARAQGQYPVTQSEATRELKIVRSSSVGMLLPPRPLPVSASPSSSKVEPQSTSRSAATDAAKVVLAQDLIHDRPLDQAARDIAAAWKRLHPAK